MPFYMLGATAPNGDPNGALCTYFCLNDQNEPKVGQGYLHDVEVSDLLKQAGAMTDREKRAPVYHQVEQMIHDRVLRIYIAWTTPPLALSKAVSGYIPNPTTQEFFNTIDISR